MTNALPTMAPWGGTEKIVGINPLAVAFPSAKEPPIVLDIAFGATAHGKIRVYHQKGHAIPEGWAFDEDGEPTTDAAAALKGLIQPIGGHKGVGLGVVIGMLSSLLSGAAYGTELGNMVDGPAAGKDGHLFIAIDVAGFQPVETFKSAGGRDQPPDPDEPKTAGRQADSIRRVCSRRSSSRNTRRTASRSTKRPWPAFVPPGARSAWLTICFRDHGGGMIADRQAGDGPHYATTVRFALHEGRQAQLLELIEKNASDSVRNEPACLVLDVLMPLAAVSAPYVLLYEIYRNRAAFESQAVCPLERFPAIAAMPSWRDGQNGGTRTNGRGREEPAVRPGCLR